MFLAVNVTSSAVVSSVLFKQASLVSELKSWCLSKLQNMEVRFTGEPSGTKLQRSSSAAEGLNEADDGAGVAALPAAHELHNSPTLLDFSCGEPGVAEGGSANHYFVVHVESSPGTAPTNILILHTHTVLNVYWSSILS